MLMSVRRQAAETTRRHWPAER